MKRTSLLRSVLLSSVFAACGSVDIQENKLGEEKKPYSSVESQLLNFEFDGYIESDSIWSPTSAARDQLLYTVGHLNEQNSVGRLDKLEISNTRTTTLANGKTRLDYHAKLPVGWGNRNSFPSTYTFRLPLSVDYSDLAAFAEKHATTCIDWSAHDVDSGSMFYYYRPGASACKIDATDTATFTATVTRSTDNTTGKYPEFHKVWEDNQLNVIAIFGKYEDGKTANSDAGIAAYNSFLSGVRTTLGAGLTTVPAVVASNPGVSVPDVAFSKTFPDGRTINVTALLVDNIRTASPAFYSRYETLTPRADLVFYNGHAGLGDNVRALARRGSWVAGQYMMLFMNGCDTFAYVDGSLAQTRAALNPDDPAGSKYMDIITNVMPSYFQQMPNASLTLIRGLSNIATPRTYEEMFRSIDDSQVIVVTGEEDNVYVPGYTGGGSTGGSSGGSTGGGFTGLSEKGTVAGGQEARFETTELPAGSYVVELAYDPAGTQTGDADLYTRLGAAPTTATWECRPYSSSTIEKCDVVVTTPTKLHVMVRGYSSADTQFSLTIR